MTPIPGCGDGGWTLAMKIDGTKVFCFVNINICPCDDHKKLSCEPYRVKTQIMKTKYIKD